MGNPNMKVSITFKANRGEKVDIIVIFNNDSIFKHHNQYHI